MPRLIFLISLFVTLVLLNSYVNGYKIGILGKEVLGSYASEICPSTIDRKQVESKYLSLDFKDTYTIYKIITNVNFTEYDTLSLSYYIEKGKGQILLLNINNDVTYHTILDDFSTKTNKWYTSTYKIPSCSDFNAIAIKNISSLKVNLKQIFLTNSKEVEFLSSKMNDNIISWSWDISDIETIDDYTHIQEIKQYGAFSMRYEGNPFYYDYVEFELMQKDLNMDLIVATDSCGDDYRFGLGGLNPEKDGDWYKFHIDISSIELQCNINRFSFINLSAKIQELSIKNFYAKTNIKNTSIANNNKQYECDELASIIPFFNEDQEIDWINISEKVDHMLFQPNRILAYGVNPDGYISFETTEEYTSPILVEMEVLTSYTHWIIEFLDSLGNVLNKIDITNKQLSMDSWTVITQSSENATGEKKNKMKSFKIYHDSTKNEDLIIRSLHFHPYSPPIESGISGDESCCSIKYCACEVVYETVYFDDDDEVPADAEIIYDYKRENKETENDDEKKGDIQKRSLYNRIGSFLRNLNI
ncbi:hypothetical protein BCR36DRAFT_318250 [Piromyces finnis]|uniref:Uncharacterized protein n=1 Tax=Piromyces finnis TaxID=1754191 RepID=A0A1Y1VLI6_9FUNG|nr:hypothetical protein BCR36DRAFT_318250 [Piromyces finnis]|eukprot:ORX58628.1 hypothetical protein BCR36DRAFT_318250 [Piromyces finnis]